ncbi:hypothetical protein VTO58DRAFT_107422 [Aureobasidium pullulans]|nr:hypothetical protein JADG_010196 [Aureobasidium pullulans]THX46769.1 hypothetical protein D6D06_09931 [Aureobasidium pullulans]
MPVTRKRKAISPDTSKQNANQNIKSFGRVTKSQPVDKSVKKRKILDPVTIDTLSPTTNDTTISPEKDITRHEEEVKTTTTQSKKRSRDTEEEVTTPQNKRFRNALPPTPAETPSKSASTLFERLIIDHVASAPTTQDETVYDTPPFTPRAFKSLGSSLPTTDLPPQLQELTRLFRAFLSSTSLYASHNGLGTPMYITSLLPHVTRTWKKRAVTEHDFQIMLGVLGKNDTFELADNGEGSLCIELLESNRSTTGHFNQPEMTQLFQDRLSALWNQWTASSPTARSNIEGFLAHIPRCEVITSQVAASTNIHMSKGAERLQDLKAGAVAARAAESASRKPLVHNSAKSAAAVASRGSSLLDRILAKQAANLNKVDGPTPDQLARLSALDRITDIVDVLDNLAAGRARASFSTKTLVSNLQNSLRSPLSAEEGLKCLELMAAEVSPTFVKIIRAGSVDAVVVTRAGKPSSEQLSTRLDSARAA